MNIRHVAMLSTALFCAAAARADTMLSHKVMMSKEPAKVWTSGAKQRKELTMPVVGKQIIITRADKGVEWTINPAKKTYSESPLALPYTPLPKSRDKDGDADGGSSGEESEEPTCTPQLTRLSATRKVAGFTATGYRMSCKEDARSGMTLWQAAATPETKKAEQDLKTFAQAHSKAQFKNYPPKERAEMEKGQSMLASLMSELPAMLTGQKLPEGFPLATEMESAEDGKMTLYEVTAFNTAPIPADMFEIPAGYKKSAASSPFDALKDMNLGDAMKGLQGFGSE